MPSFPRRAGEHAHAHLADRPASPAPARRVRGAARGAVLVAVLAGTTVFAAHAGAGDQSGVPGGALTGAFDSTTGALIGRGSLEEASRSQERTALAGFATVAVDGKLLTVPAADGTIADALAGAGVELGEDDEVTPGLREPVPDGGSIVVVRVAYEERTERTEVPFAVTEKPDGGLSVGQRDVVTEGRPGIESVLYRVRIVDGEEAGREEVLRTSTEAVDEVVRVGSDPRSIARSLVEARGWGSEQFSCLDSLWTKESNWNPSAQNASSGAYGIPQSLPGSKMGTIAADWRTNPETQIRWGLEYIAGRYGTPCAAWSHSQSVNWY